MSDCTIPAGAPVTLQGMTGSRLRCILVDDHPAIRVGVRSMLAAGHISVVGEAQSGEAAVELVARRLPDVVVMDVNLGRGMDGFAACREITVNDPRIGVVLLTGFGERGFAPRALEHGARGYVLKHAPADDMVRAVRTVAAGGVYVDPVAALDLVAPARRGAQPARARGADAAAGRPPVVRHRPSAVHLQGDGALARPQRDDQAQRQDVHASGRRGGPPQPDLGLDPGVRLVQPARPGVARVGGDGDQLVRVVDRAAVERLRAARVKPAAGGHL